MNGAVTLVDYFYTMYGKCCSISNMIRSENVDSRRFLPLIEIDWRILYLHHRGGFVGNWWIPAVFARKESSPIMIPVK